MRETNDLSYNDLQRIVESIQTFLYIDQDEDGRQRWDPDKQWSLSDACDHVAYVLSQHDLVPEHHELVAAEQHRYVLDHLDGPLFRRQRQLLLTLIETSKQGKAYAPNRADQNLLNGLVNLTDSIADQAHDNHRIDCLLESGADSSLHEPDH